MANGAAYVAPYDAVALAAGTAKTVVNVINASNALVRVVEFSVSLDGTDATKTCLVELCKSTQAAAGTATSVTIAQTYGPTRTVQATASKTYTTEPTVLTPLKRWRISSAAGSLTVQFPLGREFEQTTSANGIALRLTSTGACNADGHIEFEEG